MVRKKDKIKATTNEDFYVTINKRDIRNLSISLEYDGPISAPVDKGSQIANIIVSKKDEVIKKLPLYATEDLKKVNFLKACYLSELFNLGRCIKKTFFYCFRRH